MPYVILCYQKHTKMYGIQIMTINNHKQKVNAQLMQKLISMCVHYVIISLVPINHKHHFTAPSTVVPYSRF